MTRAVTIVRASVLVLIGLLQAGMPSAAAEAVSPSAGTIERLEGDIYRVDAGGQSTLFLATPEGIVLLDPISRDLALWLREVLDARFPGQPVVYLVHTHYDSERAGGASVFSETATRVAQARFNGAIARLPRASAAGVSSAQRTFERSERLQLGGRTVELWWAPTSHAPDMTVVLFPEQRLLFASDLFPIGEVPDHVGPQRLKRTIASLRTIEALPFDKLLTGRGETVGRQAVTEFREYVEDLDRGVRQGFVAGDSLEAVQARLTLEKYSHWKGFERVRGNVADVFHMMRRTDALLDLGLTFSAISALPCPAGSRCSHASAPVSRLTLGVAVARDRWKVGIQVVQQPTWTERRPAASIFPGATQLRDLMVGLPVSYRLGGGSWLKADLDAGPVLVTTAHGNTIYGARPFFVHRTHRSLGWMAGATLSARLTSRFALTAPLHLIEGGVEGSSVVGIPRALAKNRRIVGGVGLAVTMGSRID